MDRKYVLAAFGYGIIWLILGIYMAATKNHTQLVTHAHIMLVGFVLSFIYGVCYKVWLANIQSTLYSAQFYLHQVGTLGLSIGLFLMFKGGMLESAIGPLLGISSILVLAAMVIMKVQFIKSKS